MGGGRHPARRLAAAWSVARISFLPPKLSPRALEMATATTHVIVDTPTSSVLDLRQNTDSFQAMNQRVILLGNVIANGAVREAIRPAFTYRCSPPDLASSDAGGTTAQPGAFNNSVSAIAKSTDEYRMSINADPTVPMLDIYAQAPNPKSAAILANAAVDCLRQYLSTWR